MHRGAFFWSYCALGAFGSDEGADAPQNACVVRRLPDHARRKGGVVVCTAHPVSRAAGAHGVLGNALKKRNTQTKMEKQRPQAPENGFRFAMAPLLGRSGAGLGPPEPALRPRIGGCCQICNCRSQRTKTGDPTPEFSTQVGPIVVSVSPPPSRNQERPQGQQVD